MSRTKKDILDTESMLTRLTNLLVEHDNRQSDEYWKVRARADAELLHRISMTLHRWHELECGDSNANFSSMLVRGRKENGAFIHDDNGAPFYEEHDNRPFIRGCKVSYFPTPDREAGARKRLALILKRYPTLTAYVQTNPRGCALYILQPGDVREGSDVSSCYSNGLAVYQ